MMHDTLQPRRAASERTRRRGREPFRENPLIAGRQGATEPTRPDTDPHRPPVCWQIRQKSLIGAVDPRRGRAACRARRGRQCRAGHDEQPGRLGLNPFDNKPARCERQIAAHDRHPSSECRPSSARIAPTLSQSHYCAQFHMNGTGSADFHQGQRPCAPHQ
jgi:hypothetical protein